MVHTKPVPPPHHHSDDSLKWEEFFGTSVDISSSLLDMYDNLVSQNKTTGTTPHKDNLSSNASEPTTLDRGQWDHRNVPADVPGTKLPVVSYCQSGRPSGEDESEKKRPLSVSSLSSSSSSSSSSLPRNALDVKKSYLASIESLDDELSEDGGHTTPGPNCSALESSKWPTFRDKNPSHIERVLLEIVETERTYVRDLRQIIRGYLNHVHVGVSEENLKGLFGNIEDICRFNSTFLADLEQCGLDAIAIASCFVLHGNGFAVYTQYCTNYPRTVAILTDLMRNRETAEIFKVRQRALHHSLPLGSYLLKPVQRILKYHLLLQNIVMHADKESDGYLDIKNALSVMTGIAFHINEMKRKHEHAVRVQEIQSLLYGWQGRDLTTYGELVAEGSFRMLGAKALRHILLFDKILLVAKKKEEGILIYKAHIMCSDLMLIESIRGEPLCFHVIPFDNPRLQFTFQARNVDQKREWCLQLKQVILENYNAVIPSHARQLVLELGQTRNEDSGPVEKSSTRRLLSAPEYLERRRHERRKSNNRSSLPGKSLGPEKVSTRRTRSCHRDASSDDHNPAVTQSWSVGQQPSDWEQSSEERTKLRRGRIARRTWNGLAEETTDTENEEAVRPAQRSFTSQAVWHGTDPAGEYVMFYFPRGRASADASPSNCVLGVSSSSDAVALPPIQNKTVVPLEEKSPVPSWRHNGAVRRVQSFTGLARAKVAASLHHTFSFCQQPLSRNHKSTNQPRPINSLTETTPAWLESDDPSSSKKCDSLPRSFRPGPDLGNESSPVTNFGDKSWLLPTSTDSRETETRPPLAKYPVVIDTNISYPDLPRVNGENVHPEHKIYLRQTSGRAVVKNLLSTVGSRFAIFRGSHVTDSAVLCNEPNVRASSRSSLWSERELGTKNLGNKLMQSIAWMYGNTTRGRLKKDKSPESVVPAKQQDSFRYRTNSFSLGARMALPLESEYCVPSSLIMLPVSGETHKRPNSLQSESSNNTTSSGEKMWGSIDRSKAVCPVVLLDDSDHNEDSLSDASDNSADSYYERTFEEIENVLTEELFRDSAIYSDPEDADLSAAESSSFTKSHPADYCEQRIDVTSAVGCVESPPDLVEGVACLSMSVQERRLELERWCAKEDRGSPPGERDGKEGPLQMKGWVKHVVSKLQGDSP